MLFIDLHSRTPVYEQIKEQIINLVNTGELHPNDKLPSLRQLASELKLNVNTIIRAFSDLEAEKIVYSVPGRGVFISETAVANTIVKENATEELQRVALSAKSKGVSEEEMINLVKRIFEE